VQENRLFDPDKAGNPAPCESKEERRLTAYFPGTPICCQLVIEQAWVDGHRANLARTADAKKSALYPNVLWAFSGL